MKEEEYIPYKLGSFCTHNVLKSTILYVDVPCNRQEDRWHRVSQIGKLCNKCASVISKSAAATKQCLCCTQKLEQYLNEQWICDHSNRTHDELVIKCQNNEKQIHEVPFKAKVCNRCYDKIRAAFMYAPKCVVCEEKENEIFQNLEKTITLPAYYFFDHVLSQAKIKLMKDDEIKSEIQNYCLAEPRRQIQSKFVKEAEEVGKNLPEQHPSKRYLLYPKCAKHRNNPISLCNNCLVALLNINECPYGCPYEKKEKKKAKGEMAKISEAGFVSLYPKEMKDYEYLELFVFRQIQEPNRLDIWEGHLKKIRCSSQEKVAKKFALFASATQISKDKYLYIGGANGPNIKQMKPTGSCFWINFSQNRKQFSIEDAPSLRQKRSSHQSVYYNGFIYVVGGYDSSENKCLSSCQRFNIKESKWEEMAPLKIERSKPNVFEFQGKIYAMGGMSTNPSFYQNICERYNIEKNAWESVDYNGFDVPFVNGATSLNSCWGVPRTSNLLLAGGSDFTTMTYVLQEIKFDDSSFEMNPSGIHQKLNFSRSNSAISMMDTESDNEKIALVFGGVEEHIPFLSIDAIRIKYSKTANGTEMTPFFVYDNVDVGSYRFLLRDNASSTYEYMVEKLNDLQILSSEKLEKNNNQVFKSQFNTHLFEKMWYGIGKCLIGIGL